MRIVLLNAFPLNAFPMQRFAVEVEDLDFLRVEVKP
jgi:hypothetical protein